VQRHGNLVVAPHADVVCHVAPISSGSGVCYKARHQKTKGPPLGSPFSKPWIFVISDCRCTS
jgi:hypothetical protein